MSKTKVLFVDRDGTLIEEPPDEQVDAIEKIRFMPEVFAALRAARKLGYKLAMVTNQDGLGSASFPQKNFDVPHQFMMDAFSSQGVEFDAVFVCPHRKGDGCDCRATPREGGSSGLTLLLMSAVGLASALRRRVRRT